MESKELFYILIIIILILNLLNKKEMFLNSNNYVKKNNNLKQTPSKFKSLDEFYKKRPNFEKQPLGNNKPLVEQPERIKQLKISISKKEYLPAYNSPNNFIKNSGKPGFYINSK